MSTIYSLICWGGKDGFGPSTTRTCTVSGSTFTMSSKHGFRSYSASKPNSSTVQFVGGTLPVGASSATTYYVKYLTDTTFQLYSNPDLSTGMLTTSSAGSGWVLKSVYYLSNDMSRYYDSGMSIYRVFDGLVAWRSDRYTYATSTVPEVAEVGTAYQDNIGSSTLALDIIAASVRVHPYVDGALTDAFNSGAINTGYVVASTSSFSIGIRFTKFNVTLDGIGIVGSNPYCNLVRIDGAKNAITNCVLKGYDDSAYTLSLTGYALTIANNIIIDGLQGITATYGTGSVVSNNTVVACATGIHNAGGVQGAWSNNISVGNTTDWSANPATLDSGSHNGGGSGSTPWYLGASNSSTVKTTLTADNTTFVDYANRNLRLASGSPAIDAGTTNVQIPASDILGSERPCYAGGADEYWDMGAFEKDLGYGARPSTRELNLSGLVSGSQVVVYTTNTATELARNNSTGTTYTYDAGATGVTVDFTILKTGYKPIRITGFALSAESNPYVVQQDLDRAYANTDALVFGTDYIVNISGLATSSLQVLSPTTPQNLYSNMIDAWIDTATNTSLKNVPFPVAFFGEASYTMLNGVEFSDGATSISYLYDDGLRYSSDDGTTAVAVWASVRTLNTQAGDQVKYRQVSGGTTYTAWNALTQTSTGPMRQLVQVYGDATHGNFDYTDYLVLRCPKPGYTQPMPDIVGTYGTLTDGLFVAALNPALQYATTNASVDAAHMTFNNTTKVAVVTASHTMLEWYQEAQYWANLDAQWDSDIPLTTTDGSTFSLASGWELQGASYLSGGTVAGGATSISAGTQSIAFSGMTITLGDTGTYTFTTASPCVLIATPTVTGDYDLSGGSYNGQLDLRNGTATAITVTVATGTSYTTANNTGGTITVIEVSDPATGQVTGLVAGSRVRIYNVTTATEMFNDIVAGTSYSTSYSSGTGYSAGDEIQVRVAWMSGTSAKLPVQYKTVATSTGWSVLADQQDDTVYNSNGIDGDTVTEFTADFPHVQIDIDDPDGATTPQRGYAWYIAGQMTADGLRYYHGAMTAEDEGNYRINVSVVDMKIQNVSATPVYVTGARLYRSDGTPVTVAGNGPIQMEYGRVYTTTVTLSGESVVTGTAAEIIAAIPSSTTNAAAVLAAAQLTPIKSDITKVNGYTVSGDGQTGTEWGPV